jgi:uncharacterized membrane protein
VRGRGEGLDDVGIVHSLQISEVAASPPAPHPCPLPVNGERGKGAPFIKALAFCGRHSLAFYLLHQPLLFGAFALLSLFAAPPPDENLFQRQCAVACVNQGAEDGLCERACACMIQRSKAAGFFAPLAANTMSATQKAQFHDLAVACYADAAGN